MMLLMLLMLDSLVSGMPRRNSKYAKDWVQLDKDHWRGHVAKTVKRTRLKNSPIHYISLPSPAAGFGRTGLGPSFGSGLGHQEALSSLSSFDKLSETLSHLKLAELPKTGSG